MAQPTAPDDLFDLRLARSAPDLWPMLDALYGQPSIYPDFRDQVLAVLRREWTARPADLKRLDLARDLEPDWFLRPDRAGYVFYIDRFAGNLRGVLDKIDYLHDLGITFVHFMPCLNPCPGDRNGGTSVGVYGTINPAPGSMEDFEAVTAALRARGISVCIDLVLNHTAKEHAWARKAAKGDPAYQDYYLMLDDDSIPRRCQQSLVEALPDTAPGSFTHDPECGKWVWTTFNADQWDLNWANPQVFLEMMQIMLHLANRGVDVLRLDAVAFLWKRMETRCQCEPEVHLLLRALRACCRIACSAVLHLEEATGGPQGVLPSVGRGVRDGRLGNLVCHNSLMVQFWGAIATRDVALMTHVLRADFPERLINATYATYIRCRDDID